MYPGLVVGYKKTEITAKTYAWWLQPRAPKAEARVRLPEGYHQTLLLP